MPSPILITAASKRIGLHLTKRFSEKGFPIIAHYRTLTPELEELFSANVIGIQGNMGSTEDIMEVIGKIKKQVSSLRAIIHNASAYEKTNRKSIPRAMEQFEMFFQVHMVAPYLLNEELFPLLKASEDPLGDIVHITDINVQRPDPRFDLYCSTKAGLENLSLSFARRFAPEVKVNSIAPGPVLFSGKETSEEREKILSKVLLQKEGGEECIFQAVEAVLGNSYLTGVCLPVDGGRRFG